MAIIKGLKSKLLFFTYILHFTFFISDSFKAVALEMTDLPDPPLPV